MADYRMMSHVTCMNTFSHSRQQFGRGLLVSKVLPSTAGDQEN